VPAPLSPRGGTQYTAIFRSFGEKKHRAPSGSLEGIAIVHLYIYIF